MNLWSGAKLNSFLCELRKRDTERTQRDRNWAETQNFLVYWKTQIRENFKEILRRQKNGQMPLRTELTNFGFNVKIDHLVSPLISNE